MTADEQKQMEALFAAGDPARRVSEFLPARVAARLTSERRRSGAWLGFGRAATLALTLVSSVGLGSAAVWVSNEVRKAVAPAPLPEVVPAAAVKPRPARHEAPVPAADPLSEEAALLQSALEALQRADADAALSTLDTRARRFPDGLLAAEASVARLKALLLARRDAEALQGFAALPQVDLTLPLRLTWADLLVRHGRCSEALAVLAPVDGSSKVAASLKARCGR
ncbi:MAG: hypothetical protein IPJ65_21570 [Archangiaceae bacterium]|nr:hypothetical protein [Archangiaceae bacterium]